MKRRGNRRYYQRHEVLLVCRIRDLLYDQGFTINGARGRLAEMIHEGGTPLVPATPGSADRFAPPTPLSAVQLRQELLLIRDMLAI